MMKGIIANCVALLALVLPVNAVAQQTKVLTADKHNEYGLVYSLPQTALRVEVVASHTVKKAGPYAQFAKKFIGADKVIGSDSESWEIKSVTVTPYGVRDSSTQYLMQLKPGALTYIGVSEDGMLLSLNCQPKVPAVTPMTAPSPLSEMYAEKEYLKYVDEDFVASQSTLKQAQMLAESLMEIRDAKISLTRGTAETMPTDGRQLELMLSSLAHQEGALTAAFTGQTAQETVVRVFNLIPSEEGRTVLFRMSDFGGFRDGDDYSGEPVYADVRITNEPSVPVDAKGEEKKLPKDAVIYSLPGAAEITISHRGKTLYSSELEFAQFGIKFGLAPTLFTDKKQPSYARFDAASGALVELGSADTKD